MKRIWQVFPGVAERVRKTHEEVGLVGHHDWPHAFRVGEVARQIAMQEWGDESLSHLAGLAGMLKNNERVLAQKKKNGQPIQAGEEFTLPMYWLEGAHGVAGADHQAVIDAVQRRSGANCEGDSDVIKALMDADRVVSLDFDLIIRSAQLYHMLPAVDFRYLWQDPMATYRNPKSALYDMRCSLDYTNPKSPYSLRTKAGWTMAMAPNRAPLFQQFFDALQTQLEQEGMYPFPF